MSEDVYDYGMSMFQELNDKEYESVINRFVTEFKDKPGADKEVEALSEVLNYVDEYVGMEIVGYHINNTNGVVYHSVTYEIEYSNGFLIYAFILRNSEGDLKAYNINLTTSDISLYENSRFTFKEKGIIHYIVILLMIISLLFSLITASICFSSNRKARIPWTLLSISGIGLFTFVWTTGAISMNLISIGFPTGGFGRSGSFAPFIFSIRFPLGAILYWLTKHRTNEEVTDIIEEDIEIV